MERRFGFKRLEKKVSTHPGSEEFKESLSVIRIEREQFFLLPRVGVRGHSWTRQTLSDAWEPMNLKDWFGDPAAMVTGSHVTITQTKLATRRQVVISELKVAMKVTLDEEGTGFMLPIMVAEKPPEVERGEFYFVSADIEAQASSDPYVAREHLVRDETPGRPGSVLAQKSYHVEYYEHISALDVLHEKDERENRCIGEVLEWYRGKDTRDLERTE